MKFGRLHNFRFIDPNFEDRNRQRLAHEYSYDRSVYILVHCIIYDSCRRAALGRKSSAGPFFSSTIEFNFAFLHCRSSTPSENFAAAFLEFLFLFLFILIYFAMHAFTIRQSREDPSSPLNNTSVIPGGNSTQNYETTFDVDGNVETVSTSSLGNKDETRSQRSVCSSRDGNR